MGKKRIFFSEVTVLNQPLCTIFPDGDARLPIEPQILDQLDISDLESLPNISVSCLTSPSVGGFSRTAQATFLSEQVLKSSFTSEIDSKLLQLDRLNTSIQAFLSLVMPRCSGRPGGFCGAMHIAVRCVNQILSLVSFQCPLPRWTASPPTNVTFVGQDIIHITWAHSRAALPSCKSQVPTSGRMASEITRGP